MTELKMVEEIKGWLFEAAEQIKDGLGESLEVVEKTRRNDLVTNIDVATQAFLMAKIQEHYPEDKILGEEDGYSEIDSMDGRVWIIDPIDGTLNFVLEQENFCVMLGVFEDGVGQLGFIYDVMRGELYWAAKGLGVFCNETQLPTPKDLSLADGLVGTNAFMYANNVKHTKDIGDESMGVRVSGCAGLEMIAMFKGNHNSYISNLSPWDYAAGLVMLDEFGFKYSTISGEKLAFSGREHFVAGTPKTYQEIYEKYIRVS